MAILDRPRHEKLIAEVRRAGAGIKLLTAGFYDYILQNKDDVKTRLQPMDPK